MTQNLGKHYLCNNCLIIKDVSEQQAEDMHGTSSREVPSMEVSDFVSQETWLVTDRLPSFCVGFAQ